jgi:sugar phosphate isomerase/epimerase
VNHVSLFTVAIPRSTPEETLAKLRAWGYDGVEWRICRDTGDPATPGFWSGNRCTLQEDWPDERFAEIARLTREAGLRVPNLGTYFGAEDPARVERFMGIARLFDCPSLRICCPIFDGETPYGELLTRFMDQLRALMPLAERHGVRMLLETHNRTIIPSASATWRVVSAFPASRVGVTFDPGNMVFEGYEDYRMGLDLLGDYLALVHLKNARHAVAKARTPQRSLDQPAMSPLREGRVDLHALFAALRRARYEGWISVEDFSTEHPEDERLQDDLRCIRALTQT